MNNIVKKIILLLVAATLMTAPFAGSAFASARDDVLSGKPGSTEMIWDIWVVRPMGIVGQAVGAATFFLAAPWAAAGGNIYDAQEELIIKPAKFTWKRPMGEF